MRTLRIGSLDEEEDYRPDLSQGNSGSRVDLPGTVFTPGS